MKFAPAVSFSLASLVHACAWTPGVAGNSEGIDLDAVTELARELAARPFDDQRPVAPEFLATIGYDAYRDIVFDGSQSLWGEDDVSFRVEYFHPGYIYPRPVKLFEAFGQGLREIRFDPSLFDYTKDDELADRLSPEMGFSGFSIYYPFENGDYRSFLAFQGASYFRVGPPEHGYGLSARGIAINTGTGRQEEFPDFTTFWLEKPAPGAEALTVYALLDGPSVAGAYAFTIEPGGMEDPVSVHVRARIILREEVEVLGLAPFSSMFWYGENTLRRPPDFRPEVHDSDGVAIELGSGHRIWRPLVNPPRTRTERMPIDDLAGFGLFQRDRAFENYQDIDAGYHRRPDAWVEPGPEMREGHLHLLEIETPHEYADNVALMWDPAEHPAPGEIFSYSYTLHFGRAPEPVLASAMATRLGTSIHASNLMEFVVDFAGGALPGLTEDDDVTPELFVEGSSIEWKLLRKNPFNDSWRLIFRATIPAEAEGARFSAGLRLDGELLTEIWHYWWHPA